MARSIEFDVERLLGRLNILEGTQIRYASRRALGRFAYEVRQQVIRERCKQTLTILFPTH